MWRVAMQRVAMWQDVHGGVRLHRSQLVCYKFYTFSMLHRAKDPESPV